MKGKTRIRFWLILAAVLAVIVMAAPTFGADRAQDERPGPVDRVQRGPAPIVGADSPFAIPGQYIVVFEKGARGRSVNNAAQAAERAGGRILHRYDTVLDGFAIQMPSTKGGTIRTLPISR